MKRTERTVSPRRFRRRLAIVFVLVAGLSAGFLAVTSYVAIREYRQRAFADQALRKVELAALILPERVDPALVGDLLASYQQRGGFETIAVDNGVVYSSVPTLGLSSIPEALRDDLSVDAREARISTAETTYLVVGRLSADERVALYFFFSLEDVEASIVQFRNVLVACWIVTVALAAGAGAFVARRVLRPVREAAEAARSLGSTLLGDNMQPSTDDEFGLWVQSFNDVATALEAKLAELSDAAARERRFTADVAHELRTPLTALVSAASLLEENLDDLPLAARRPAELLVKDVRRLRVLVLELLELARLDAGGEVVRLEAMAVVPAVEASLAPWTGRVEVERNVPSGTLVVSDRARFKRVIGNLIDNVFAHGGGEPTVVVNLDQSGVFVDIDVIDRGRGITESDAAHVFDRFYKADGGRSMGGSGLGLSIAREHAQAMGASLTLTNPGESGAQFRFSVLRVVEPVPDTALLPGVDLSVTHDAENSPTTSDGEHRHAVRADIWGE